MDRGVGNILTFTVAAPMRRGVGLGTGILGGVGSRLAMRRIIAYRGWNGLGRMCDNAMRTIRPYPLLIASELFAFLMFRFQASIS